MVEGEPMFGDRIQKMIFGWFRRGEDVSTTFKKTFKLGIEVWNTGLCKEGVQPMLHNPSKLIFHSVD